METPSTGYPSISIRCFAFGLVADAEAGVRGEELEDATSTVDSPLFAIPPPPQRERERGGGGGGEGHG